MIRENWTVANDSERPAGKPGECFYCKRKLGEQHKDNCVIKSKTIVIQANIEAVVHVPEFWDEEQINNYYNNGDTYHIEPYTIIDVNFIRNATKDDEEFYDVRVNDLES
jgi:hypothetical protein